jgi:hypothetical protein
METNMSHLFLGYGSSPEVSREALYTAGREIAATGAIDVLSWEDLNPSGRVVLDRITSAIDGAVACAFDISTNNENVLFELGFAIARAKPILLLLDETDRDAARRWKQFQLLSAVGYDRWSNAEDIKAIFFRVRPDHATRTLYHDLIEPELAPAIPGSVFYLPSFNRTEPARQIARTLDHLIRRGVRLFTADPTESSVSPLQWYATKVYETTGSLFHFDAPRRELAALHNPRSALVAGLAHGLNRPILMLAEEDYAAPFDYQDLLRVYRSGSQCRTILGQWLETLDLRPRSDVRASRVRLSTELRTLRFGEHVAENEVDVLSDYFLQTAAFDDVISERNALFIGRKGTGKTANMYQAAARLAEDARNLVVVIKPASYEFSSLLSVLPSLSPSLQQYSLEALWKFLLQSEIANAVLRVIESRVPGIPFTEDEKKLIDFVEANQFGLRDDFGVRFERTVSALADLRLSADTSEASGRDHLNEAFYSHAITQLRALLGPILRGRRRVAVLIDNLDKGWERSADLPVLARLLLGLLSAIGRVRTDFEKEDYWRARISLTVATFLRSDIYAYVRSVAREPDKLPVSLINWEDKEVLIRVLEERFLAARPEGTSAAELWERFFCETVLGISTREYLLSHSLPRPRDLIYLCNAAIVAAVNRGHEQVEEEDILAGERAYSQFAFESLLVENGITISQFQKILYEFLGEAEVLAESQVRTLIRRVEVDETLVERVVSRLKAVAFLGVETAAERFEFPEQSQEVDRAQVLARKLSEARGTEARLAVHPAYRAYLEMGASYKS